MNRSATAKTKRPGPAPDAERLRNLLLITYWWQHLTAQLARDILSDSYGDDRLPRLDFERLRDDRLAKLTMVEATRRQYYPKHAQVNVITQQGLARLHINHPQLHLLPTIRDGSLQPSNYQHAIGTGQLQADYWHAAQARGDITVVHQERRYKHGMNRLVYHDEDGDSRFHVPELGELINIANNRGSYPRLDLFEFDRSTESTPYFYTKLDNFRRWIEQGSEQYLTELFARHHFRNAVPHCRLWVVTTGPNGQRSFKWLTYLYTHALRLPLPARRLISFTTQDIIETTRARQQAANPLKHPLPLLEPLWYPVQYFPAAWREHIADDLEQPRLAQKTFDYVAWRLTQHFPKPRYTLFPPQQVALPEETELHSSDVRVTG